MMVGEFEYLTTFIESIGSNNERTKNPLNPFPEIAATFIFVFLLLMSIILMNLLVGNFTLILKHFKVKNDHRSNFSNLSNWKEEA